MGYYFFIGDRTCTGELPCEEYVTPLPGAMEKRREPTLLPDSDEIYEEFLKAIGEVSEWADVSRMHSSVGEMVEIYDSKSTIKAALARVIDYANKKKEQT